MKKEKLEKIEKSVFFKSLELLAKLSILVAIITWIFEFSKREEQRENERKNKIYRAWQLVALSEVQSGSGIKKIPLQDLNNEGVDLSFIPLNWSLLKGIQLPDAKLRYCSIWESDISESNLSNADLRFVDCFGSQFSYSNLENTDFRGAVLNEVVFHKANVKGAMFDSCLFWNSDLKNVRNLTVDQLKKSLIFGNTKLPSHINREELIFDQKLYEFFKKSRKALDDKLSESSSIEFNKIDSFLIEIPYKSSEVPR